jgi:hypothetical protein
MIGPLMARTTHPQDEPSPGLPGTCSPHPPAAVVGELLMIPAFRVKIGRHAYRLEAPLRIDLRALESDLYRVHLVQDFWTDCSFSDLNERLAAIFLGRRRRSGEWEQPESWPVECRGLLVLGYVDVRSVPFTYRSNQ